MGFAGTSRNIRAEIAAKVAEENKSTMSITIEGSVYELKRQQSVSGKTWWWTAEIDKALYEMFLGSPNNKDAAEKYYITINGDCTVEMFKVKGGGKVCGAFPIDESFVTIN